MASLKTFEIYLVAPPGLEGALLKEVQSRGFKAAKLAVGGVTFTGSWPDVWRVNLEVRGAARVLARIGGFYAAHLSELDKRSRKFPWLDVLRKDVPVSVEVTCHKSKIYHSVAAAQRIEKALREECGITIAKDANVVIKVRIDDDQCKLSVDTSGEMLHKRGHKEATGKAPMRENLASLFLARCGYTGEEPVLDPMCGSGTFVIEAAEIAAGLAPGRGRSFAFEQLRSFDAEHWAKLRDRLKTRVPAFTFYGSDKDAAAVKMAQGNASPFRHCRVYEVQPHGGWRCFAARWCARAGDGQSTIWHPHW